MLRSLSQLLATQENSDTISWGQESGWSASKYRTPALPQNNVSQQTLGSITFRGKPDPGKDKAILNRKANRQLGGQVVLLPLRVPLLSVSRCLHLGTKD